MSLAGRLTAFFLIALGLVLAGFSATLYFSARTYLSHQLDERLEATLVTIATPIDREEGGLKWEGEDHPITLGRESGLEQVRWVVATDDTIIVAASKNLEGQDLDVADPSLRWVQRRFEADPNQPKSLQPAEREITHPALVLTAGISVVPMQTTLRNLMLALVGISLATWLLAALIGRRLCRQALVPVTRMAVAARGMGAADMGQRLATPGTHDELEDLAGAFNDLLSRLQEAFERQRRFTGDASHQLRTPLTALLGQVEVALNRNRPAEDYRQTLRQVHEQANHLRQIVESLLFLSRANAEADLPDLETLDLTQWLQEHVGTWADHSRYPDMRLECTSTTSFLTKIHPPLFGQLIDNLLDNACKCSEAGTPITLHLGHEPGIVTIAIEDEGCGIAPDELPHVFEPFYRSPDARRMGRSGTGLGLAVAERIARAFGGTVHAESVLGKGSRFIIRLRQAPREGPLQSPAPSDWSESPVAAGSEAFPHPE